MTLRTIAAATSLAVALGAGAIAQTTATPPAQSGPRPFPGSIAAPSTAPEPAKTPAKMPANPQAASAATAAQAPAPRAPQSAIEDALNGAPIYPAAEFLDSFDAGHGQRYYLYGTNAPYLDIIGYYRTVLKNSGRELYKVPAMQQFDLGKYQEETMAYPPSVVVKDYADGASGYVHVKGTTEKHFKTIIQIVPASIR